MKKPVAPAIRHRGHTIEVAVSSAGIFSASVAGLKFKSDTLEALRTMVEGDIDRRIDVAWPRMYVNPGPREMLSAIAAGGALLAGAIVGDVMLRTAGKSALIATESASKLPPFGALFKHLPLGFEAANPKQRYERITEGVRLTDVEKKRLLTRLRRMPKEGVYSLFTLAGNQPKRPLYLHRDGVWQAYPGRHMDE